MKTPEPAPKIAPPKGESLFVVQKHDATRLHYDFRLELSGVLKSWAVPKGPSLDPAVKSLAVQVEDHPVAYARFEGIIPAGEYGGGTVLVWDHGSWQSEDPDAVQALKKGHLRFRLQGEKLKGGWSLIRLRREGSRNNWLLVKRQDVAAIPGDGHGVTEREGGSVMSQRDLAEVAAAADRAWTRRGERKSGKGGSQVAAMKAAARRTVELGFANPRLTGKERTRGAKTSRLSVKTIPGAVATKVPRRVSPQLALLADEVPTGAEWLHEVKFDGYRILAHIDRGKVRLLTRKGNDWTARFPETAAALQSLNLKSAVIDGELVAMNDRGVASFQRLQNAIREQRSGDLVYYAFDLPFLEEVDLRAATLLDRKQALAHLLTENNPTNSGPVRYSDHIQGEGAAVLRQSCQAALEGIISKRSNSPYESRRSGTWLKVKCHGRQEFVIAGFTRPERSRVGFGALLLGYYENGELQYAGRVGTGFDHQLLLQLSRQLKHLVLARSPFADSLSAAERKGVTYVRPELVAEVEFTEWTDDGRLRHPSFQGLREDKAAKDVVREAPPNVADEGEQKTMIRPGTTRRPRAGKRAASATRDIAGVTLTHPERALFPDAGVTKQDLARYYAEIAEWVLPNVIERPLSLVRCPDGSTGQCFYQKHWKSTLADAIGFVTIRQKSGSDKYVQIQDLAGLISLVQISVLEIHPWGAKSNNIERPDRMVIDLDPGPGVAWADVQQGALDVRKVLDEFGLQSFLRTSGGKGLHIVVPLSRRNTWDEVATVSRDIAAGLATHAGDRYVSNMRKSLREGRIYVDSLRNQRGSTAIAAYSTRSHPGCPVATPIDWKELGKLNSAAELTISNVPARMKRLKRDPWEQLFKVRQSLTKDIIAGAAAFADS